jgi:lysyl-tRNA synthetase class 2
MEKAEEISKAVEIVQNLKDRGENPYPAYFPVEIRVGLLGELRFSKMLDSWLGIRVSTAGRVVNIRSHPNVVFIDIWEPEFHPMQVQVDPGLGLSLERGDIIGVSGEVIKTLKGDYAIKATEIKLLSKCLIPFPGFDHEVKENRALSVLLSQKRRRWILSRAQVIWECRRFLREMGFIEIPTPVIQPVYGGASAEPFTVYVNAKGIEQQQYLRISPELYLKRLIIMGFDRVFEIGPQFRNEDMDPTHHPEFISLEVYQSYADYNDMARLLEQMVARIAEKIAGSTTVVVGDVKIDLSPPWRRIRFHDALKEYAGINTLELDDDSMKDMLEELGVTLDPYVRGLAEEKLFQKLVEPKLKGPVIIVDYPWETTPLCKRHREDPRLVERFEGFIGPMEIANAYTELNDPSEQYQRFRNEEKLQGAGHPLDWQFIEDLMIGMPPTGGLGVGLDRLAMILSNAPSIKDIIAFPIVRRVDR